MGQTQMTPVEGRPPIAPGARTIGRLRLLADLGRLGAETRRLRAERAEAEQLAGLAFWSLDLATGAMAFSHEAYRLLGRTPDELEPSIEALVACLHPEDRAVALANLARVTGERRTVDADYRMLRPDGSILHLSCRAHPVLDRAGSLRGVRGLCQDITERVEAEARLRESEAFARSVLESTTDSVMTIDRSWRVTYMNGRAAAHVGSRLGVGDDLRVSYPEHLGGALFDACRQALDGATAVVPEVLLLSLGIWLEVKTHPTPGGISIFFRDVTLARRAREEIRHLAHHDPLTGLGNRTSFNGRLAEALSATSRDVAVLILDLDAFKEVNDDLGHPVGDALLVAIAGRLGAETAGAAFLARLGGDEFAVIHPLAPAEPAPEDLARRLIGCLDAPFAIDGNVISMGASVGIATTRCGERQAGELFRQADIALYEAKAAGRGRFRLYERELHERFLSRQSLKQDLATAAAKGEFRLVYQPMLDLASGRIGGYEALLRWDHPREGAVPPLRFVPLAEETGLIVEIGEWVVRRACRDGAVLPDGTTISVNLSPVQFRCGSLPLRIARALADSGLDPARLELEITESVLLNDSRANLEMLHALKALGVRIALDDFGTGFSSLSYLRRFPFDKIKIDRCFVGDIGEGPAGAANPSTAIVAAVIDLGRVLGMTITAEGVETAEQLEWLRERGCQQVQGYLVGRPAGLGAPAAGRRGTAAGGG